MYLTAETITLDDDEGRYTLTIEDDEGQRHAFLIHHVDLDAFYDQVKGRLGPYLREMNEARQAVARGVTKAEYLADEYRHEVQTGQHAPDADRFAFMCNPDEGYAADDPKSEGYHDRMSEIHDNREKV